MVTKFEYSFLAFPDKLWSNVSVTAVQKYRGTVQKYRGTVTRNFFSTVIGTVDTF